MHVGRVTSLYPSLPPLRPSSRPQNVLITLAGGSALRGPQAGSVAVSAGVVVERVLCLVAIIVLLSLLGVLFPVMWHSIQGLSVECMWGKWQLHFVPLLVFVSPLTVPLLP